MKPPLFMVVDSDDTEYRYANIEDALVTMNQLYETWAERQSDYHAYLQEGMLSADDAELEGIISTPEPYMQKWSADDGGWIETDVWEQPE